VQSLPIFVIPELIEIRNIKALRRLIVPKIVIVKVAFSENATHGGEGLIST
jgi:hypothetical protein